MVGKSLNQIRVKGKFVNTRYSKNEGSKGIGKYEAYLLDFEERGKCPFCPGNHNFVILKKIGKWQIVERSWKKKTTRRYLLVIGEEHKTNILQLLPEDWVSVGELLLWATKKYKIKGGGFGVRFGDTDYSGATINHLHFHLIAPGLDKNGLSIPTDMPIG